MKNYVKVVAPPGLGVAGGFRYKINSDIVYLFGNKNNRSASLTVVPYLNREFSNSSAHLQHHLI